MASGPGQPPAGPPRLADSLARHRWVAAAGMTATIAVVAGGGLALARHDSSPGPPKQCGLVPCAAALPASVQSSGDGSARPPAAAAPTGAQHAATPPGPAHSPASPAGPAPRAAPPEAAPSEAAPPEAASPEAASPAERPAYAARVPVPEPRASCTTVIAFTARGPLSTPVRCTFTEAAGQQRSRDGAGHPGSGATVSGGEPAVTQVRPGRSNHHGWLASWLSGWPGQGWPGGGWTGGGWSGTGRSGGGWPGSGGPGQYGGWPGGR